MIFDMDFFRKVNNAYGSKSKKETTLYTIKKDLEKSYDQLADYQPDTIIDGKAMPLLVMESRGAGEEKDRTKKIEAPPGSVFHLGSKVDCFGLKWLVTSINYTQEIKLSGTMRLCNYVLRWQHEDGRIIEEECVCDRYKTSATGEDINRVITVDDTRRNILIQYNPVTASITQGKRFFIDLEGVPEPKPYRLTDLDRTSYIYDKKGFFSFVCAEDFEIGSRDRPDLMICDYIEPGSPLFPLLGSCEIVFDDEPVLKAGGSAGEFVAIFKDEDGNILESIEPQWDIEPNDLLSTGKIEVQASSGNLLEIRVKDRTLAGTEFVLRLSAIDAIYGDFLYELTVKIVPLL